jgi:hypothetical protein
MVSALSSEAVSSSAPFQVPAAMFAEFSVALSL